MIVVSNYIKYLSAISNALGCHWVPVVGLRFGQKKRRKRKTKKTSRRVKDKGDEKERQKREIRKEGIASSNSSDFIL